ncbi:hypothetical protein FQN52_005725 [Onygenales sp. PD_12]|nr:hypothetical protein FQN53_002141 [Emmonsiellopsis sp. PD_33]KAK2790228.1 hypothetical protein FQN52_005725 [Onygenales sp. PD_12]
MVPNIVILGIRGAQALFSLIILGLTAYVINSFRELSYGLFQIDSVNFLLFAAVWTLFIVVPYLVLAPIYFPALAHKYGLMAAEALTMIFWFAGFIAVAAILPAPRVCASPQCHSMQAATVFGAFEWLLFVGAIVLTFLPKFRGEGAAEPPQAPNVQMQAHQGV